VFRMRCQQGLQYEGNHFEGAVLPGRPQPPEGLDGQEAMRLAVQQPCAKPEGTARASGDSVLLISSAAGYERRRQAVRDTYLSLLDKDSPFIPGTKLSVQYRFLLGAPRNDQRELLEAEQQAHGDLLQVSVPESYETLWPKVVASWRWAVATYDFKFWMHADDDSFVRLDLLLPWLATQQPSAGLYAGYMWDGSEGRRTRPLRDPSAKSYMPHEQWPEDFYPPFASGCGFILAQDLVETLAAAAHTFTFFRVIDVPVGVVLSRLPEDRVRLVHMPEVRPYRPLPLFRSDTIVQHYMQPEEFKQFFQNAYGGVAKSEADLESEKRISAIYDLFVGAKVMRR